MCFSPSLAKLWLKEFKREPKMEWLRNLREQLFVSKYIILSIGSEGTTIAVASKTEIIYYTYISAEARQDIARYAVIFEKYQHLPIYILLDNKEIESNLDELPAVSNFIGSDVAAQFITKKFSENDIVAHNVLGIEFDKLEKWKTLFISTPITEPIKDILKEIVAKCPTRLLGIYFLPMELTTIIPTLKNSTDPIIYEDSNKTAIPDIFITVNKNTGVRLIITEGSHLLLNKVTPYPTGKSLEYLRGVIEQDVEDAIILSKKEYNAKCNLILLLEDKMHKFFQSTPKLNIYKTYLCNIEDFTSSHNPSINRKKFSDLFLISLFLRSPYKKAYNHKMNQLDNLSLFNKWGFKPFFAGALLLFLVNAYNFVRTQQNYSIISKYNTLYFTYSNEYSKLRKKYPDVKSFNKVIDVLFIKQKIEQEKLDPILVAKECLKSKPVILDIQSIKWKLLQNDRATQEEGVLSIYGEIASTKKEDLKTSLLEYKNHLQRAFPKYHINYKRAGSYKEGGKYISNAMITIILRREYVR